MIAVAMTNEGGTRSLSVNFAPAWPRPIARHEGATFATALRVCAEAPKGATVFCMLPETGERYLSTPLFADIPADMNEDEIEISRSTPAAQMAA